MKKNPINHLDDTPIISPDIIEAVQGTDELLTVEEIAGKMKVPVSFFYTPCRRKGPDAIPCIRVGKYLRYHLPTVRNHFIKLMNHENE